MPLGPYANNSEQTTTGAMTPAKSAAKSAVRPAAGAMKISAKKIAFKGRRPYGGGEGTMVVDLSESGEDPFGARPGS